MPISFAGMLYVCPVHSLGMVCAQHHMVHYCAPMGGIARHDCHVARYAHIRQRFHTFMIHTFNPYIACLSQAVYHMPTNETDEDDEKPSLPLALQSLFYKVGAAGGCLLDVIRAEALYIDLSGGGGHDDGHGFNQSTGCNRSPVLTVAYFDSSSFLCLAASVP